MLVGTPAMWFIAVPVLGWALWRAFVKRDWRYAVVLTGYCAGYLPWFADIDRQMYFFYAAPMAPFLVMAIALILGDILYAPRQNAERHTLGLLVVCLYVARCHYELRVDVPDPHGAADLAVDLEHADLAAQLALARCASRCTAETAFTVVTDALWTTDGYWLVACRSTASLSTPWEPSSWAAKPLDRNEVTWGQLRWKYRAIYPDVYTPRIAEPSLYANTVGAWLWSGREAPVTGRAASALHGSLWVDAEGCRSNCSGPTIDRPAASSRATITIASDDVMELHGMAVATPQRTAYDLGPTPAARRGRRSSRRTVTRNGSRAPKTSRR